MWDKITYPFPNFNDATVVVWERVSKFIKIFTVYNYLSTVGLKLIKFSKRGPICIAGIWLVLDAVILLLVIIFCIGMGTCCVT